MGLIRSLLRARVPGFRATAGAPSELTLQRDQARREVLGLAVRETVRAHGIPPQWVRPETMAARMPDRSRGMHLRLVVRECRPEFMQYTVGVQIAVRERLQRVDPLSAGWLAGISWRFENEQHAPALPRAHAWTRTDKEEKAPGTDATPAAGRSRLACDTAPRPAFAPAAVDFSPTQPMMR